MTGYKIELGDDSFRAMLYAVRERRRRIVEDIHDSAYVSQYKLIESRLDRAYPIVGIEAVRFPHSHLEALYDVMILAVFSMDKTGNTQYYKLNSQKLKLKKHLASDVISRMASLTK